MKLTREQWNKLRYIGVIEIDNELVIEESFGTVTMYQVTDHYCSVKSIYNAMTKLDSLSNAVIDYCRDWIAADQFLGCAVIEYNNEYKYKRRMLGKECPDTAAYLFGTSHVYGDVFEDIRIKL